MKKELTLREIQLASLSILKKIDKICSEKNLTYYLAYGTLIGAVRHHGFIPWDDDIDIMMPRKDYEKFIDYCKKENIAPLKIFTPEEKNYPYGIARLNDQRYELDVDNEKPYGAGTFVDIYPIDCFADNYDEMCNIKRKASRYSSLLYLATRKKFKIAHTKGFKRIIKLPAFLLAKVIGPTYFKKKLNKMVEKNSDDSKKFIGCLIWGTDKEKGVFKKELFQKTVRLKFEDGSFMAPKEYDQILKRLYGDYMTIPPKEKQIPHHDYKAYRVG